MFKQTENKSFTIDKQIIVYKTEPDDLFKVKNHYYNCQTACYYSLHENIQMNMSSYNGKKRKMRHRHVLIIGWLWLFSRMGRWPLESFSDSLSNIPKGISIRNLTTLMQAAVVRFRDYVLCEKHSTIKLASASSSLKKNFGHHMSVQYKDKFHNFQIEYVYFC